MTVWRPSSNISFKAIGLLWRDHRLLAAEIYDDSGNLKGVRPLGGTVEIGETAEAAVKREFEEELGIAVHTVGQPIYMENIYTHEGTLGHEILAIFEISCPPNELLNKDRIEFHESSGNSCIAKWFDIDGLDVQNGPTLYPKGLKTRLGRGG